MKLDEGLLARASKYDLLACVVSQSATYRWYRYREL